LCHEHQAYLTVGSVHGMDSAVTLVAHYPQVCNQLASKSIIGRVVHLQFFGRATGHTSFSVGRVGALAHSLPPWTLDVGLVLLRELKTHIAYDNTKGPGRKPRPCR
jgi:hypothetical protein